ncbi:MAG: NADH-quinone oxidoreductase subunit C [Gammaproteobacteria bacterium]|nr:NADH-quinone oxidoreductase subunit C [Gammaproteobacteria bacterium]
MSITPPVLHIRVAASGWLDEVRQLRARDAHFLALWGSDDRALRAGFTVRAAFLDAAQVRVLEIALPADAPELPGIATIYPSAARMQRGMRDLLGIETDDADKRAWVRHAGWARDHFPLRHDAGEPDSARAGPDDYPFVHVRGDGVHEVAVGPVHAGIIEPGHFRFSVVGEKVLRLETRLGYAHKGIERRFTELSPVQGQRLAARVSGDSAAAFSWAYCMALEQICGIAPPPRALFLRALLLERERIANHLGDLGALANDAGLGFGLSQFSHLKEELLRLNARVYGARYPMDEIVPGGTLHDLDDAACEQLLAQCVFLAAQSATLRAIIDDHAGVQDRFSGCGVVPPSLAQRFGLCGLAGRASGQPLDLRCDLPLAPWDRIVVRRAGSDRGDVAARVAVRFDELEESLRLCTQLLRELPQGAIRDELPAVTPAGFAPGLVEGWRGPVLVALQTAPGNRIHRCHPHDPSWHNWPVIEHAVIGNIVPDFPLINKSFNLSYSGVDL